MGIFCQISEFSFWNRKNVIADKLKALISPEEVQGNGRDPVAKSHHEAEAENLVKRAFELLDTRVKSGQFGEAAKERSTERSGGDSYL